MKIYCEKCKKVFDAEKPADGGQVECTNCKEKVDYPASSTAKGVVIGDFVIERELSKGGMGEVFLARQLSLDRPVALKLLQAKFLNDKEYVEAFFREARAAGRINHPNVIQAYAVGEENGIFYFAMEYIRGKTMKEILKEKKVLDFTKAAQVIKEVASALECAWRDEKLVHQDIKPDNIMLDANGFAKLADLGLARVAGINDKEATEGDEVLGTPQYISPEQLTGVPTDVRSDIYSLGATFYHFVTGRFPYVADTSEEIAQMHVTGHLQPPKEVNPELPDELNTIILKMMSRNIEDRYQTPAPLIKALDMYLLHSQTGSPAVPHLNLRLPKASAPAGGGRPATPFGGAARSPFGGGKTPFAGRAPGGAGAGKTPPGGKPTPAPAANPPKPAAEPVVKTAVPPPKAVPVPAPVASPKAVPVSAPVAQPKAVPAPAPVAQPKAVPAPAPEEPAKSAAKPDDNGEILSLKVVQKPEKKTPPPEASAPEGKSGKKKKDKDEGAKTPGAGKKVAIYAVCLGIMAICLGGVFYFLAIKNKLPGPVKPFGDKVVAWVKGEPVASPGESSQDASSGGKGGEAEESKEPLKSATRPEYLAGIENLLQLRRSNPEDALGFLKKSDEFFRNYPAAQTPEEQASLQRYLPIYHQVDEIGRVAPARKAAREKFLADLKMRHEAADTAKRESAARQEEEKRRQAQAEAEARNAAEENRRREAEERERFLAETLPKLTPLLENAAESFFPAIRTGEMATFNQAITDLQLFKFPDGGSGEELRLVTLVNSFCVDLPREVKKIRAFGGKLAAITPSNGSFSVEGKDRSLITVVGISPAGVAAVDGSGKPISCDLADARLHTLVVHRLEGRKLENPALYLDMLTGTFSDETAKAAARHDFWKKYYQPFMTAYFRRLLSKASASERVELEKRYGKLPEFRAAK